MQSTFLICLPCPPAVAAADGADKLLTVVAIPRLAICDAISVGTFFLNCSQKKSIKDQKYELKIRSKGSAKI